MGFRNCRQFGKEGKITRNEDFPEISFKITLGGNPLLQEPGQIENSFSRKVGMGRLQRRPLLEAFLRDLRSGQLTLQESLEMVELPGSGQGVTLSSCRPIQLAASDIPSELETLFLHPGLLDVNLKRLPVLVIAVDTTGFRDPQLEIVVASR